MADERLDLDALERAYAGPLGPMVAVDDVRALIAELRVARERISDADVTEASLSSYVAQLEEEHDEARARLAELEKDRATFRAANAGIIPELTAARAIVEYVRGENISTTELNELLRAYDEAAGKETR